MPESVLPAFYAGTRDRGRGEASNALLAGDMRILPRDPRIHAG